MRTIIFLLIAIVSFLLGHLTSDMINDHRAKLENEKYQDQFEPYMQFYSDTFYMERTPSGTIDTAELYMKIDSIFQPVFDSLYKLKNSQGFDNSYKMNRTIERI